MRVLLDEDVPVPLIKIVRHILRGHEVDHISEIGWSGKKDVNVYMDAKAKSYDVVVTNNLKQLNNPDECDAIKKSGRHVVFYEMANGLDGLALGTGSICAAIRSVVMDLGLRKRQHLVWITSISATRKRFRISDPAQDAPSPYWR